MRPDTSNYREIFLNDRPMMDARAPVEFVNGAFPHTVNLPLMSDTERQKVGTCYKQHGQQAAIAMGHQLVSGALKTERIEAWLETWLIERLVMREGPRHLSLATNFAERVP